MTQIFLQLCFYFSVDEHWKYAHKGHEKVDKSESIKKCQHCYQGPFSDTSELLKHLAGDSREEHYEHVDKFVKRIGLEKTLLPIKPQPVVPPTQSPANMTNQEKATKYYLQVCVLGMLKDYIRCLDFIVRHNIPSTTLRCP